MPGYGSPFQPQTNNVPNGGPDLSAIVAFLKRMTNAGNDPLHWNDATHRYEMGPSTPPPAMAPMPSHGLQPMRPVPSHGPSAAPPPWQGPQDFTGPMQPPVAPWQGPRQPRAPKVNPLQQAIANTPPQAGEADNATYPPEPLNSLPLTPADYQGFDNNMPNAGPQMNPANSAANMGGQQGSPDLVSLIRRLFGHR